MIVKIGDEFIDLSNCIRYKFRHFITEARTVQSIKLEFKNTSGEVEIREIVSFKNKDFEYSVRKMKELVERIHDSYRHGLPVVKLD